jgi:AcrR family transcriptional regulator
MAVSTALRRTQSERTAETREALLEAAIACLVDVGYAGTTTRLVAGRAGVSRGAQTHHFPTKPELVAAAIEYLFDQQATHFRDVFGAHPRDQRTLEGALEILWDIVRGPSYAAVLEVTVAARTDPDLRVVVHAMTAVLENTVVGLQREFFPSLQDERLVHTLIDIGFTLVQGAAISSYSGYGDPEHTIKVLKNAAALITPQSTEFVKGILDALDP